MICKRIRNVDYRIFTSPDILMYVIILVYICHSTWISFDDEGHKQISLIWLKIKRLKRFKVKEINGRERKLISFRKLKCITLLTIKIFTNNLCWCSKNRLCWYYVRKGSVAKHSQQMYPCSIYKQSKKIIGQFFNFWGAGK